MISQPAATSIRSRHSDLLENTESGTGSNEDQDVISAGSDGDEAEIGTSGNKAKDQDGISGIGAGSDEDMDEISTSSNKKEIRTHCDKSGTCHDEDQDGIDSNSDTDGSGNTNQGSGAGDCEAMSVDNCSGDDNDKFNGPSGACAAPHKIVGLTASISGTATAEAKNIADNSTSITEMTAVKPIVSAVAVPLATTGNVRKSYPIVGIATSGSGSLSALKGPDSGPGITVSISATLDQGDAAPTTPPGLGTILNQGTSFYLTL